MRDFSGILGIAIVAAILLPFIVFGGAYRYVSSEAEVIQTEKTDAIVVPGAAQFDGKPSPVLKARLCMHAEFVPAMGLRRGSSLSAVSRTATDSLKPAVGREWLIIHGVPSSDVIAADGSNTRESMIDRLRSSLRRTTGPRSRARFRPGTYGAKPGDGQPVWVRRPHEPHSVRRWKSADQRVRVPRDVGVPGF